MVRDAPLTLGFHLIQLRLHLFRIRLPQHRKPSIAPLSLRKYA